MAEDEPITGYRCDKCGSPVVLLNCEIKCIKCGRKFTKPLILEKPPNLYRIGGEVKTVGVLNPIQISCNGYPFLVVEGMGREDDLTPRQTAELIIKLLGTYDRLAKEKRDAGP